MSTEDFDPRSPLEHLIAFSLRWRGWVLAAAALSLALGVLSVDRVPVDLFPDLSRPTVTVITESPGMAPEEVEPLVTFPVESALNGAPGVTRLRSISADGISVVWVEFAWGEDIYRARQVVSERLQRVELPAQSLRPELGPISSIMGEITFVALTVSADRPELTPLELRTLADVRVRRALLAIPGISQVISIGGDIREVQVEIEPVLLAQYGLALEEVLDAVSAASRSAAAGFHVDGGQEYLVRGSGRAQTPEEIGEAVVAVREGVPVRVRDLGTVRFGPAPARGTAAYRAEPAVVLSVQKQLGANTLEVTREIDRTLAALAPSLPVGVAIETENFRQSDFIELAVGNVSRALRDGAILVVVVLLVFLGNWRSTLIAALAIPLSLGAGVFVVWLLGGSINTMTLGGLTIAIGALVDDAIIDVENVLRRLRGNHRLLPESRRTTLQVVFRASSEVRKAILFATLIIGLVLVPLFLLPGIEGRLLRPLGLAYLAALTASLLVSLTVTPALCSFLLAVPALLDRPESWLLRRLGALYRWTLDFALLHRRLVVVGAIALLVAAALQVPGLGRNFLPLFNEGSLTVAVTSSPGIPLAESDRLGRRVEEILLGFPEVVSTSRRTGRAERDEHVQGVNRSEIEVVLRPLEGGRKDELVAEMREAVAPVADATVAFGQPISHRIDHMLSGSRTNLAVKVLGPDLEVLRSTASQIHGTLGGVAGIVDLSNEEQAPIPRLVIDFDRRAMARYGVAPAELSRAVEALFQGTVVGELVSDGLTSGVVVRFPERLRSEREALEALPVLAAGGEPVLLGELARVDFDLGPSMIRRENVERVAMVTANVAARDLTGTVEQARRQIEAAVTLPTGYRLDFGGQFEEAVRSSRNVGVLSICLAIAMYGLLYVAFGRHRDSWIVLVNLPLALIGGVFAVSLTDGVLSIATMVGFVTLFGIATRNGVLLVTHYRHLQDEEGLPLFEAVHRGSRERLAPVLMTALTAGLALVPLVLAGGEPGNEIQSPMARVILGGLLTSTFLNLVVVPVLFVGRSADSLESASAEVSSPVPPPV